MTAKDGAADAEIRRRIQRLRSDLDRNRASYEEILVHLATMSRTVTDRARRGAMELLATVVSTDYEMKVLFLKALSEPADPEVWEKHLALAAWTAIEELPQRIGADHREAGKAFKTSLKPVKDDTEFMQGLTAIRNKVVAHHDLENGNHWLAQWHLLSVSRKHKGQSVLRSKIIIHAGTVLDALKALSGALLSQHPDLLPRRL